MLDIILSKSRLGAASLLLCFLFGCATFFGNNNRQVVINSVPTGASVYMDNVYYGKTPVIVLMPRAEYDDIMLVVKKDGYQDTHVVVTTQFQEVGYWNFIVLPAFLFDFATGCMFEVKPGEYRVNMLPLTINESYNVYNESSILKLESNIESR